MTRGFTGMMKRRDSPANIVVGTRTMIVMMAHPTGNNAVTSDEMTWKITPYKTSHVVCAQSKIFGRYKQSTTEAHSVMIWE